jgi:hypothetical protein
LADMNTRDRFNSRYFGPRGIIEGIRLCMANEHTASALGLICAAVESMAFLGLPEDRDTLHDFDFVNWANTYLKPHRLGIDGRDLWMIRCALLNQRVPQRRVNTDGRPRETLFAWGGYLIYSAMELRPGSRWHRIMMIHADELYKAIFSGAEEFCGGHISNPENARLVSNRLNQVFGQMADRSN